MRFWAVTVITVFPETDPLVAVMMGVPAATAVARPLVLTTVAMTVSDDDHVTDAVMSALEPLEYVPVAVNCWVAAIVMLGVAGVTAIEEMVTASLLLLLLLSQPLITRSIIIRKHKKT